MKVKNVNIQDVKPYANNPRDNDAAVGGGSEEPPIVRLATANCG